MSFFSKTLEAYAGIAQASNPGVKMFLTEAEKGVNYRIIAIDGQDKTKKHLSNIGFVENGRIRIVNEAFGNLVCEIKGGRVAIDKGLASRITVLA